MPKILSLILLFILCQIAICQDIVPLNKYGYAITDTLTYKPVLYQHTVENSDSLFSTKNYDTAGVLISTRQVWMTKEKKRKIPTRSYAVQFSPSGDTTGVEIRDLVDEKDTIQFFEEGILFAEVYREKSLFTSGWEITASKDTVPLPNNRFTSQLNNQEELYSRLKENLSYPPKARRRGIEGSLIVVLEIDKEGKVKEMIIGNPEFEPLFEAEVRRVLDGFQWDFSPKEARDGTHEEGFLILPVRFIM
ncbi:energy transducer TonB [Algoriphagus terrigena]|uniref:energy transducer TonB n=1 Tax=Algoriphagus terrigena TaxID=344884 RepID=UPI000427ACE5|nr:energy transducer TonB [Algoriphagus terrigena]